jgi:hypothetical protein
MSVYVDESVHRFRNMRMCHMLADTDEELFAMADRIGLARRWLQRSSSGIVHCDVCKSKRALAVEAGAIEIDRTQLAAVIKKQKDRCSEFGGEK